MKKNILCSVLCLISTVAFAQSITLTPTSAGTNSEGKMYYSTTTHTFHYWNGTSFISLGGSSAGVGWSATGNDIINTNTGNVGVGLSSPLSKLHINSGNAHNKLKFTNAVTGSTATDGFDIGLDHFFFLGNNFTNPVIMNRENTDLIIGTNNLTRMTVTAGGNIGIGKYPTTTLDVNGSVAVNGEVTNPAKTGSANMIPIAYGTIDGVGMQILSGSGNFSITRTGFNGSIEPGRYLLEVNNETFTHVWTGAGYIINSHVVLINVLWNLYDIKFHFVENQGKLELYFDNAEVYNTYQNVVFSFVIYKP